MNDNFKQLNNFSFVTLEYLEAYGNRLRWNLILNIPINILAVFLILRYSTSAMGIYKYFILSTIIAAFLMDFHSSFIYGFYDFVPLTISCPTGITRKLGWFWGTAVNYAIIHFTMSFCGSSLMYSIIYQYYSLTKNASIFRKPKTIIAMFASVLLYPIPSAFFFILTLDYEKGKAYVFANFPEIAKIFISESCSMQIFSPIMYAYFFVAVLQIFIVFIFSVILGTKLSLKLHKIKNSLSSATLKAHKQYVLALYIQGTVPFILIIIPLMFMIYAIVFNLQNSDDLFQFAFQCFGLHSFGNSVAVIYIIKPYRKAVIQWIKKFFKFFYKKPTVKPSSKISINIKLLKF